VWAQVEVTESFNIGTGTRFDLFLDNDIVRPAPGTLLPPPDNPAPNSLIVDSFDGERMFVENGNIVSNKFGLTNTQNAGGAGAGEFGGEFNWFNYGGVADTTLGGELNHSQEVVIKAKMRIDDIGGNDQRITLGYYNLPATPAAADFNRGAISAGIGFVGGPRFVLQINGNNSGAINIPGGYDPETHSTDVFDVDLTLKFSEESGMAWFEGMVAGIPINEFTFTEDADAEHPFDAFAISQSFLREAQDAYRREAAWMDDLTYSVVSDLGIDTPNPPRIGDAPVVGNGGDYNDDGTVNAADYVAWRDKLGDSGTPGSVLGDGTGDDLAGTPDGDVDQFDYSFWRSRFGNVLADSDSSIVANNVPEPASALLLFVAILALPSLIRYRPCGDGTRHDNLNLL
jgi:hypothetical protein